MSKKIVGIIAFPVAVAISAAVIVSFLQFEPALTSAEEELLRFTYEPVQIIERQPLMVTKLISPIEMPVIPPDYIPPPPEIVLPDPLPMEVSLVILNSGRRIAIIDGHVVSEGDFINGTRIAKIERDRVFIVLQDVGRWIWIR